jgi:hypothetical protein
VWGSSLREYTLFGGPVLLVSIVADRVLFASEREIGLHLFLIDFGGSIAQHK